MEWWQVILAVLLAIADAVIDANKIKQGKEIDHLPEAIYRGFLLLIISLPNLLVFPFLCAVFWIVFEIVLNKLRGLSWHYVGKTAWQDVMIRKIFPKNTGYWFFGVKVITLIITNLLLWTGYQYPVF